MENHKSEKAKKRKRNYNFMNNEIIKFNSKIMRNFVISKTLFAIPLYMKFVIENLIFN